MVDRKLFCAALFGSVIGGLAVGALHAAEVPPPKAYVVAEIAVTDPVGFKTYADATPPVLAKFGGTYVARGGNTVAVEGAPPAGRIVLMEFPNLAAAQAYEASPDYRTLATIRHKAATSRVFIVEGVGGGSGLKTTS
jgi:uncharacterized protein (DUF1330 family)